MKSFMKVLLSVVVVLGAMASISFAATMGSTANKPCPIVSVSGTGKYTTCAAAAGTVATAVSANSSRVGGYILNVSTAYLKCSLTGATTTLIDAGYFVLYPFGTANDADRFNFVDGNGTTVYQGPVYFKGYENTLGVTYSASGVTSSVELK
jgi:hypothetical protein